MLARNTGSLAPFALNPKTARAFGIKLPATIVQRSEKVIA
jgi:hypothetical protein